MVPRSGPRITTTRQCARIKSKTEVAFAAAITLPGNTLTVELKQSSFGIAADGSAVELFTFSHKDGMVLSVTNYGCVIQSLMVPDRDGKLADIVLGYDTLAEYEADKRFLGCVVGRYANRIAHGKFTLDGTDYQLETNPKGHHLHGGGEGFHKQVWRASVEQHDGLPLLSLHHSSPHGHGGYPGNVGCKVTYAVTSGGEIEVSYYANTDQKTIINLTNHSYFNMAGHEHAGENGVLDHLAHLNCDTYLPTDALGIPISAPVTVADTPMDFRTETSFAKRIHRDDVQLKNGGGYDHNWVVNQSGDKLNLAARVIEPDSGRVLEVLTTQPGIQCYTGNNIDDIRGKGGMIYKYRGALCLETQHFPNSPNQSEFPSTIITPEESFYQSTVFRPGVRVD